LDRSLYSNHLPALGGLNRVFSKTALLPSDHPALSDPVMTARSKLGGSAEVNIQGKDIPLLSGVGGGYNVRTMQIRDTLRSIFSRSPDKAAAANGLQQSRSWRSVLLRSGSAASVLVILSLFVASSLVVSNEPDLFDVEATSTEKMNALGRTPVPGVLTTNTIIAIASTLLEKPGGYLSNDILPPGIWVDNMPAWEFGVLVQVRDISKVMRENLSRSQTQSAEDADLIIAEPGFNFPNDSWIFPASESQYREAIDAMESYLARLTDPEGADARFFTRADNLNTWLANVESRLGSLSQRLSASVARSRRENLLPTSISNAATREMMVQTPWHQIDDVFYEARGASWALLHLLRAIEVEFRDVLEDKNAAVSVAQIIRELEATQSFMFSPIILNGDGFGFMANHSLVMASYISRANAGVIDLRALLQQG
jgi:hypothetical protein